MSSNAHPADVWQRRVVLSALVAVPLLFVRPAAEPFQLPKATYIFAAAIALLALEGWKVMDPGVAAFARARFGTALGVFLTVLGVATVASPTPGLAFWGSYEHSAGSLLYVSLGAIALTIVNAVGRSWFTAVVRALALVVGVVGGYALLQAVGADPFEWQIGLAASSTLGQPNFTAGFLGAAIPAAAGLAILERGGRLWPTVGIVATVLGGIGLATTRSVQGVAAASTAIGFLVVALGVRWLFRREMETRSRRMWVAGAGATLFLGVALAGAAFGDAVREGIDQRLPLWDAAVRLLGQRPLLGTGPDTFGQHFFAFRSPAHGAELGFVNAQAPHNVPLSMFTSAGVLGGIAYLVVLGVVAAALLRGLRKLDSPTWPLVVVFGAIWLGYQVQSLVSIDVPSLALLHFVSSAAIVGLARSDAGQGDLTRGRRR